MTSFKQCTCIVSKQPFDLDQDIGHGNDGRIRDVEYQRHDQGHNVSHKHIGLYETRLLNLCVHQIFILTERTPVIR